MTTLYPGGLDSFPANVDGVSEVIAADVNNLQDAIEALEAQHQARSLRKIKNGSGATVAVNKIGYFDVAGDFVTTTTASFLASPWAAVISGGANNTQIVVAQGRVTIELTANCSIGDFLISSTTTGRAGVVAAWEAAVLAVALTANTDGAGGTCEAMLFPEIGFWVGFGIVVDEVRARTDGADTISVFGNQSAGGTFDQIRIRSNVTNNSSVLQVIPNGTGASGIPAAFEFFGTDVVADSANLERLNIRSGTTYSIFTSKLGTGTIRPLGLYTQGNTNQLLLKTNGSISFTDFLEGVEITAPAAGAANSWRIYGEDNGAGKTRVMIQFATGVAQQIAIQP